MKFVPYHCIHCGTETQNFSVIHMVYEREHYTHSYGQNYYTGSETVNAGEIPVFVCSDCIYQMVTFGIHPVVNACSALALVLICVLGICTGHGLGLSFFPLLGACYARWKVHSDNIERADRRIDRNGVDSAGFRKSAQKHLAHMTVEGKRTQSFLLCNLAVIIAMLVLFVLGLILKGTAVKVIAWIMVIPGAIGLIINLVMIIKKKKKNTESWDPDVSEEAAKYYIYHDGGIWVKEDYWNPGHSGNHEKDSGQRILDSQHSFEECEWLMVCANLKLF